MSADLALAIARSLNGPRFDLNDEIACHEQMEVWLKDDFPTRKVEREYRLSGGAGRPDFYVEGVAVEVKMNAANPKEIVRQITRYAACPLVAAVVVATNRALQLPGQINGKPIFGVSLGRAWL